MILSERGKNIEKFPSFERVICTIKAPDSVCFPGNTHHNTLSFKVARELAQVLKRVDEPCLRNSSKVETH